MKALLFALAVLLPGITQAAPEPRPLYSAQDTLAKAGVGTSALRPPPLRRPRSAASSSFDRWECYQDPTRPLGRATVCLQRRN